MAEQQQQQQQQPTATTSQEESTTTAAVTASPRDGPAIVFESDPKVIDIFHCQDGDYYGLVLVAMWPPSNSQILQTSYEAFIQSVKQCFDPQDFEGQQQQLPAVYLYPHLYLHVTIATFAPPERRPSNDTMDYESFQKEKIQLLKEASKLPNWPIKPARLAIKSTQIGSKAGILLWEDTTGTIQQIRNCLQIAAKQKMSIKIHAIPGIIHSTFLRFTQLPKTPGRIIQERFQSIVIPNIHKIFNQPIETNTIKLVCESTPYMHIPDDEQHVLWSYSFTFKKTLSDE